MKHVLPLLAFIPFGFALTFLACSDEAQEPTSQALGESNEQQPTDPPSEPEADGGAANASICSAISPYCAYTFIYPLSGPGQKCYCQCDAAKGWADCANMPTSKACGTVFDVYQPDPMGGPGNFVYAFQPSGTPFVCHSPSSNLATTAP